MDRRSFLGRTAATGWLISSGLTRGWAAKNDTAEGPVVATSSGKIKGLFDGKVHAFKGVPYGASTEGENRFMPPARPKPWTGVRNVTELGARSFQPVRIMIPEMGDALTGHGPMSDDCLTLNLWTSNLNSNARKPIMVWFHGGGMRSGWSGSILYDGAELAGKHDVVVVGVNHRLNVFGFLYLAETRLDRFANSANLGALDLIAALEWIRDNAASFGGDPANVTIFGQSGGGGKVATVQSMPAAKGLFHRMIIGSTLADTGVTGTPKDEALKWTEIYLRRLGLKPNQAEELRKFSAETLVAAMAGTGPDSGTDGDLSLRLVPVVDGKTMPVNPFDPVAPEVSANIPLMTGTVETESVPYGAPNDPYWTTNEIDDAGLREQVKRTLRVGDAVADQTIGAYKKGRPKASNFDLATIIASDASPTRDASYIIAERKAKQAKAPAYLYYFKWYSPLRDGKVRCMHSMDLPFVFDHVDAAQWMTGQGRDRYALAEQVSGAWVAFARSGNPNHKGLPQWNPFNAAQRPTMVFDSECNAVDDPYREERLAIKAVLDSRNTDRRG
jgi:para-nitrobenzyl esterase